MIAGIDEAGRGPMMGPLVIAGVIADEKDIPKLEQIGVKDSKLLTPAQREDLFDKIKTIVKDFRIMIVLPREIDDAVEGKDGLNLNWLEANKEAQIVSELKPEEVIIDCPSTNIQAFTDYIYVKLSGIIGKAASNIKIRAEHKADMNYVIVGAASILAKVTRDREIEKLKHIVGENFGSGYPSDPYTKEFLAKNWKNPKILEMHIFRKSWQSYKNMAKPSEAKKQTKLAKF